MFSQINTFQSGVHIPSEKNLTSGLPIIRAQAPDFIYLPLSMHIGSPAEPVVKPGDKVKIGQLVAKATGFVSSNIHSSVSGMVMRLERRFLPNGMVSQCLVIKNDFADTMSEDIHPRESGLTLAPETIRQLLQEKGIVGMGGATFPTHVKYAPQKSGQIIDTIILNGIECEPYVTADHRVLMEYSQNVIRGLKYFMKAALAKNGIIAIEDNKPDAIALYTKLTEELPSINVVVCPEKYPQGSEKHLVYAVTKRVIPDRGLPASVGVILDNVATAAWAALAVKDDIPCYERVVTISGNAINKPGNYLVRLGSLYSDVVEKTAGGYKGDLARIISGGPMMGFSLNSLDFPIMKGTGGLLLFNHNSIFSSPPVEEACVRCGRCVEACPMFLEPTLIAKQVKKKNWPGAMTANISACIECGSCAYMCPAHIPLVQYIRMGKQFLMTNGLGGHNPYYQK